MSECYAVVLAAGSGRRMGGDIAKQYRLLCGKPVLYYSLKAFEESRVAGIVLVVSEDMKEYVRKEIIEKYHINKIVAVVSGGNERQDSVWAGISVLSEESYVLVHDGARPFVTRELIERLMDEVHSKKACIPVVPVKDTIKRVNSGVITATPNRTELYAAQTPQAFETGLLIKAFQKATTRNKKLQVTDDAMLVEEMLGQTVSVIEGDYRNIKLTTAEDMLIAEVFCSKL